MKKMIKMKAIMPMTMREMKRIKVNLAFQKMEILKRVVVNIMNGIAPWLRSSMIQRKLKLQRD